MNDGTYCHNCGEQMGYMCRHCERLLESIAATDERAKIVTWLRNAASRASAMNGAIGIISVDVFTDAYKAIERGEHLE